MGCVEGTGFQRGKALGYVDLIFGCTIIEVFLHLSVNQSHVFSVAIKQHVANDLLPHVIKLLDEIDNQAAIAILKITGDDSYARRVVEKWRTEEELDEPKFLQQAADELEDEIERIITKRPLEIPTFVFFRH